MRVPIEQRPPADGQPVKIGPPDRRPHCDTLDAITDRLMRQGPVVRFTLRVGPHTTRCSFVGGVMRVDRRNCLPHWTEILPPALSRDPDARRAALRNFLGNALAGLRTLGRAVDA